MNGGLPIYSADILSANSIGNIADTGSIGYSTDIYTYNLYIEFYSSVGKRFQRHYTGDRHHSTGIIETPALHQHFRSFLCSSLLHDERAFNMVPGTILLI